MKIDRHLMKSKQDTLLLFKNYMEESNHFVSKVTIFYLIILLIIIAYVYNLFLALSISFLIPVIFNSDSFKEIRSRNHLFKKNR